MLSTNIPIDKSLLMMLKTIATTPSNIDNIPPNGDSSLKKNPNNRRINPNGIPINIIEKSYIIFHIIKHMTSVKIKRKYMCPPNCQTFPL